MEVISNFKFKTFIYMTKISITCRTLKKKMSWTLWLNPVALSPAVPIRRKERSRKKRTGAVEQSVVEERRRRMLK